MAYNVATFARLDRNADGSSVIVIRYTGDAGELPVERNYPVSVNPMPSADYMRAIAMTAIADLNKYKNFIAGATPNIGSVLDTTTPLPSDPASTYGLFLAASAPFTPGTTPQDVFTISGSATRTVQVVRAGIMTTQTTAGLNVWDLLKRSTANSGGTSSTLTAVPADSAFPAATAVVRQYTANPTAGTLVGRVWGGKVAAPVPASAVGDAEKIIDVNRISSLALRGTGEVLAWNFGGAALPTGLSVQAWVVWTEN